MSATIVTPELKDIFKEHQITTHARGLLEGGVTERHFQRASNHNIMVLLSMSIGLKDIFKEHQITTYLELGLDRLGLKDIFKEHQIKEPCKFPT